MCGLAIVIAAIAYVIGRKTLSAQDYYLSKLPDPSFATLTPNDAERARVNRFLSGVPAGELEKAARQSSPAKLLAPVLDDIIHSIPVGYREVRDVFAGVYPSGQFNAYTLMTPAGGYLILVNHAFTKGLWEWAKLVVDAMSWQGDSGLQPDNTLENIIDVFNRSTQEYVDFGKVPAFPDYATDEYKRTWVALLARAAVRFILAHEYAHILLGHAQPASADFTAMLRGEEEHSRTNGYLTKELDADKLAVEIVMGRSSVMENKPELQVLGIYYSLAIFEALNVVRSGDARDVTYPGLEARRRAVTYLLKRDPTAVAHPIVDGVMSAVDYLVLNVRARGPKRSAVRAGNSSSHLVEPDAGNVEAHSEQTSANGLRDLLDTRKGMTATQNAEFVGFMREFVPRRASNDWRTMRALVSNANRWADYVNILMAHAVACSLTGVKTLDLPWSPGQALDASGFTELAIAIVAARQGKARLEDAVLDGPVRSRMLLVWRMLYGTTLGVIGASGDSEPTRDMVEEARDRNMASLRIIALLRNDPVLNTFSVVAAAWIFERMGDKGQAASLRSKLEDRVEWPPITKDVDGKYVIVYPQADYSGNKIPALFKDVL